MSRIELPGMTATMYLAGDKLVVVAQGYQGESVLSFSQPNYFTQVKLFDVSAKDAPVYTGGFKIDGATSVSRLVSGKLVLVQNTRDAIPQLQMINEAGVFGAWTSRYETKEEYLDRPVRPGKQVFHRGDRRDSTGLLDPMSGRMWIRPARLRERFLEPS